MTGHAATYSPELLMLPSVPSTNSWLKANAEGKHHGFTVVTSCQTAGRGQRGNTWESEEGMNLTFSTLLRPQQLHASCQFRISEAVSLAVALTVESHLSRWGHTLSVKVKWPNDVYVADSKICGILIENTLDSGGNISHSVAGIGLNVNQREFLSDAPNPVSLANLTGNDTELLPLLREVVANMLRLCEMQGDELHALYMRYLYRADGEMHQFFIPSDIKAPVGVLAGEADSRFLAAIHDVEPSGTLLLRHPSGRITSHLFKEVAFLIQKQKL